MPVEDVGRHALGVADERRVDDGAVRGDQVVGRLRRDQRHGELLVVERVHQLAPEVLGAGERTQQVRPEQGRRRRVGAEEARGRGGDVAIDDRVVDGHVVPAEAPAPGLAGLGRPKMRT